MGCFGSHRPLGPRLPDDSVVAEVGLLSQPQSLTYRTGGVALHESRCPGWNAVKHGGRVGPWHMYSVNSHSPLSHALRPNFHSWDERNTVSPVSSEIILLVTEERSGEEVPVKNFSMDSGIFSDPPSPTCHSPSQK